MDRGSSSCKKFDSLVPPGLRVFCDKCTALLPGSAAKVVEHMVPGGACASAALSPYLLASALHTASHASPGGGQDSPSSPPGLLCLFAGSGIQEGRMTGALHSLSSPAISLVADQVAAMMQSAVREDSNVTVHGTPATTVQVSSNVLHSSIDIEGWQYAPDFHATSFHVPVTSADFVRCGLYFTFIDVYSSTNCDDKFTPFHSQTALVDPNNV